MKIGELAKRTRFAARDMEILQEQREFCLREIPDNADILDFRSGWSPEHHLPSHITKAAEEAIEKGSHYSYPLGVPELRQAIATKLMKENMVEVDPETQVLVTNGGSEAMFLAVWATIDPDDEVIMANPGYVHGFEPNVLMVGARMVYVPAREERNFKMDPQDIKKSVTNKTRMIIIVTPENPTGAMFNQDDLERIAEIAVKHDLMVISDEAFEKLTYDGKKNLSIGALPGMENRVLSIYGFAKSYNMPGYRVGYVVGPQVFIRKMSELQFHVTVSANEIGQYAALAALEGPQDWLEDAVREYNMRRNVLVEGLNRINGVKCQRPEGGFGAFVNMKEFGMTSLELSNYLLKKAHVKVGGGAPYFGANAEGYVKISFCRPRENILKGIDRIGIALEEL